MISKESEDVGRAGRASRLQKWMELSQQARQDLELPSAPNDTVYPQCIHAVFPSKSNAGTLRIHMYPHVSAAYPHVSASVPFSHAICDSFQSFREWDFPSEVWQMFFCPLCL